MEFNSTKCKVMVFNVSSRGLSFKLNNISLEIVKRYKYLGITFSNRRLTSLYTEYFALMLEKARKRLYSVLSIMDFIEMDFGETPDTAIKMYKQLVRPILEYS